MDVVLWVTPLPPERYRLKLPREEMLGNKLAVVLSRAFGWLLHRRAES
jgi:hypothetical protein